LEAMEPMIWRQGNVAEVPVRLRQALDNAGFSEATVSELLGPAGRFHVQRGEAAPVHRRLAGGSPLTTLIRLFVAGQSCDAREAQLALGAQDFGPYAAAGVIAVANDRVLPLMAIEPLGGLFVASDAASLASQPDYVMGPSGPSRALAGLTVRHAVGTTVDIGSGCGLQALLAAAHSRRVVAYDVNPRAVYFTGFNARLNDLSNIHGETADLFEWMPKEEVGLVVSNPPYVVSPGLAHIYRDSQREGDSVCRHLASAIPRLLAPMGVGQFMANWIVRRGESWADRLRGWFAGSGCDVWILHETTEEASSYVANWLRETDALALRHGSKDYDRWMAYFEDHGIVGVGYGLVSMQRHSRRSENIWIDPAPDTYTFPCSAAMARYLERRRSIAETTVRELLAQPLRTSPDLVIDEIRALLGGQWTTGNRQGRLFRGLCWQLALSPELARVVERSDGTRRLDAVIDEVARTVEVDPHPLVRTLMPAIRCMLERGLMLPGNISPADIATSALVASTAFLKG